MIFESGAKYGGVVDGQENPTNGINIPSKVWTWHQHATDWHYMIDPLFITANGKVWKEFSKEDQQAILEAAKEAEKYGKALSRVGLDDGSSLKYLQSINKVPEITDPYGYMESKGMKVTKYTPEMIEVFYKATAPVREKWTKNIGPDLVAAAEEDMKSAK